MGGDVCGTCDVLVYQAEGIPAGNRVYHKGCFKCNVCGKLLSSNNSHLHNSRIHCRTCHSHAIRPASPALFADTSKIKPTRDEDGCPNCGGSVYEAEKVTESGKTYHKKCFVCCKCRRPQDDKLQVFVGFDKKVYCAICYPKLTHTPMSGVDAIKGEEGEGCPRCGGKVFQAERVPTKSAVYHKNCFSCHLCTRPLDASICVEFEREVYCSTCYRRNFDIRSKSVGPPSTSTIKSGSGPTCPRCEGVVFEAEKVVTKRNHYHRSCLSCANCRKYVGPAKFTEAEDGDVYCKACYAVLFGHRRARSIGPSDTRLIQAPVGDISRCLHCGGKVFEAEKMVSASGWYHASCFKCYRCNVLLDSNTFNNGSKGTILCNGCFTKGRIREAPEFLKSHVNTTSICATDSPGCPRCGGKVFEAEKMVSKNGTYHRRCFACDDCGRLMDYFMACDGPDMNIFCKACYAKNYGITEIKISEADKALDTSLIKPKETEQGCPRCKGAVFKAEEIAMKGRLFHKRCLTCKSCSARLDSLSTTAGEDEEIYCRSCYAAKFLSQSYHVIDPASVKGQPGDDDCCYKCGGRVYDLEKVSSKKMVYHKSCFNCTGCKTKLDSTLVYAFEAPDNNIYCKRCYGEQFGTGETPLTWSDTTSVKPADGQGCPRCGGAVFKAEEIMEKGRNFHLHCFTCKVCNRPQKDKLQVFVGFDGEIYCKGCYPKIQHTPLSGNSDTSVIKGDETDGCPRCRGKVFPLEKVGLVGKQFHKKCFNCAECHVLLNLTNFFEGSDKEVHCKNCYVDKFFVGGKNCFLDYSQAKPEEESEPGACRRCKVLVYEAEQVLTSQGPYHRKCLACADCRRTLDCSNYYEGRDGQLYCKNCYASTFGHMARAEPGGDAGHVYFPAGEGDVKCPECSGKVFEAEKTVTSFGVYHRSCFKCSDCSRKFDATPAFKFREEMLYCKPCLSKAQERWKESGGNDIVSVDTTTIMANEDDPDRCPNCGGKVFEAERQEFGGRRYHGNCFFCGLCRRKLDSSLVCDLDSKIVCKNCYNKNFVLRPDITNANNTSIIKPSGGDRGCPRCGGAVFKAEEIISKSLSFHKKCLSCAECRKTLDRSSFFAGHGEDKEIYCKGCHGRKFGGVGYRGALTISTVDMNTANKLRPATPSHLHSIKAQAGEEACLRCEGKIFEAEMFRSKAGSFHKSCFTCKVCRSALHSSLAKVIIGTDKEVYCKKCHGEKFGLENIPAQADTQSIQAVDGNGCPRCNGKVFTAELVVEKGRNFHQKCFTCKECSKPLTDKLQVYVHGAEVYCKICYPRVSHQPIADAGDTSVIKGSGDDTCPRCEGKVYEAEKMKSRKYFFHKNCFCCKQCKHHLSYSSMFESKDGEIFCKVCYVNLFFTLEKNVYMERKVIPALEGDTACVSCKGKVYDIEKVLTKHGSYHLSCLACFDCNKVLNTSNFFAGPDQNIYCRNCYDNIHGKRARSRSRGPVNLAQFHADEDEFSCLGCGGKIFEAEKFATCFGAFHMPCFKCSKCAMSLHTSPDSACSRNGKVLCRQCYGRERSKSIHAGNDEDGFLIYAKSIADSHVIPAEDGDPLKCPRCSGKVFEAEKMAMKSGCYHKKCFSCTECRRPLDYSLATDGPDMNLYCHSCYARNFGPQSFKSDIEALYRTDVIKPGDGSGCPNCGGAVFEAEKVISKGKSYHKKCAKCFTCSTRLDSRSLCDGPDGGIYCNGCYSRKFGGANYRGTNTHNWVDGQSIEIGNGFTGPGKCDPDDPNACMKCQGRVYELERISSKNGVWHKHCFNCNTCRTSLNSTLVMAFESPDNQVYCKSCYLQAFGEGRSPLIYTETSKIKKSTGEDACTRCSGTVYEAEKVKISDKLLFHRFCFTCAGCKVNLDSLKIFIGPNSDVFCKTCYKYIMEKISAYSQVSTDVIKGDPKDRDCCPRCEGKVFEAEKIPTKSRMFHKSCFSCKICNHKLEASNYIEGPNDEIFCKTCYARDLNALHVHNFTDKKPVKAEAGEKDACLKCACKVFMVDRILAGSGVYHKHCLECFNCHNSLTQTNFLTGPNSRVFCRNCYEELYGVRGRSGSVGRRVDGSGLADENDPNRCGRCSGKVFDAEKILTSNGPFHRECFSCIGCQLALNQKTCNAGQDGEIYCTNCYSEEFGVKARQPRSRTRSRPGSRNGRRSRSNSLFRVNDEHGHMIMSQSMVNTTSIKAEVGDKDRCPKCAGKVFEAEKMDSGKGVYHRKCFTCLECSRSLDSYSYTCGPNKELYCANCFSKLHGPSVRQFNEEDARKLISSIHTEAKNPKRACQRCRGTVYSTEELYSNGRYYHKKCAKCASCARSLDFNTVYDGPDKDIYCKGCYGRKFGIAGYRGISSSTWTDEEAGLSVKPCNDTAFIQAQDDSQACFRCHGKVFEAEKVVTANSMYHKSCFRCFDCSAPLDSKNVSVGPNKHVYCRTCYGRHFSLHGFGFEGFIHGTSEQNISGMEGWQQYHYTSFF